MGADAGMWRAICEGWQKPEKVWPLDDPIYVLAVQDGRYNDAVGAWWPHAMAAIKFLTDEPADAGGAIKWMRVTFTDVVKPVSLRWGVRMAVMPLFIP